MGVHRVQHARQLPDGGEDVEVIGVYSTEDAAQAAVARPRRRPGFSELPEGVCVDRYELDEDPWADGLVAG